MSHWFFYTFRILPLLFVLVLPEVAQAQFTFTTNNGAITITRYTGSGGTVVIPASTNGLPVTTIGNSAFESSKITSVTIPDSVTNIGNGAFEFCSSLANVSIGNGLTNLGQYVFLQCVTLTNIAVDSSNPAYSSAAGALFDKTQDTLIQYPVGLTNSSYAISNSVTVIAANAFSGGGNLLTVTIPDSVTNIGDGAFSFCFWLNNLTIPEGVTSIGDETFEACWRLTNIPLPSGLTSIGDGAFWGCSALSSLVIPAGVTNVGNLAFVYCYNLTSVYFEGNAPPDNGSVFGISINHDPATVYYSFGATGWGTTFSSVPVVEETDPCQFTYTTNNEAITITGHTGPGGSVVIPQTINGYPVIAIGELAFNNCTSLASVIIPYGVTCIGDSAFWGCANLANVTLPNTITTIGSYVFQYCSSLANLSIPASVTNIEQSAFFLCSGLTNIAVDASNPNYSSLDGVLFDKMQTTLIQYPLGLTNSSYIVPNSVTNIGEQAFDTCIGLTGVTIPNGVTTIGDYAFAYCFNLASVNIPGSVTTIGNEAFLYCTSLTGITLPNSIATLGENAFMECTSLTYAYFTGNAPASLGDAFDDDTITVFYLPGTTGWGTTFDGAPTIEGTPPYQFTYVTNNVSITVTGYTGPGGPVAIPDTINGFTVTSIGDYAFLNSSFASVFIPDTITNIGMNAFAQCYNLTSIIIPDSITNIEFGAFEGCTGLMNVILPDNLISIGDESFFGCMSLTNVVIPASVTSIGNSTFGGCTNLNSITIPNNVTNIGVDAFLYCLSMTNISVDADNPDYSSLNGVLFDKAQDTLVECPSGLTNKVYVIPDGVVTIAEDAFDYSYNVTSFTIPGSLTNIVGPPFNDCTGLTNICVNTTNPAYATLDGVLFDKAKDTLVQYPIGLTNASYTIPNSVTTIQGDAFSFGSNLVSIIIPTSVTNIGAWGTFLGCSSLSSIVIPNGVASIPDDAFSYCTSLASVIIPGSVTSIGLDAFVGCSNLTSIIIPASVTNIEDLAFLDCGSLTSAYFQGNAPAGGGGAFGETPATVYYLPGTTGWGATFGNVPAELWNPQAQNASVTSGQFGFEISGPTNATVVIQACTNLANPVWIPVSTNVLDGNGTSSFSDSQSANSPSRFYRFSSP